MIVVDTSGVLALLDRDDAHHDAVSEAYDATGHRWLLPWAILPEVDYLASKYLGERVALEFTQDILRGAFRVEGFSAEDLKRAVTLQKRHASLRLGLVDAIVMAVAVRQRATAIVTLDSRHFRAVSLNLRPAPKLVPLDD